MRNAYHRVARLATHPGFSVARGCLLCWKCGDEFGRVTEYEAHFIAHDPSDDEAAWWWLSGNRYNREWKKRGWRAPDEMLSLEKSAPQP